MTESIQSGERDSPTGEMARVRDANDVTFCLASDRAARTIQRIYRGYRTRRELKGLGLRRLEHTPRLQEDPQDASERCTPHSADESPRPARQNWHRAVNVAIQASDTDHPDKEIDYHSEILHETTPKMMDLEYFLEMVDTKHRHGSNLRAYHSLWKSSPSRENFFYWLDLGEGRDVEHQRVSRERLERDQVRYLSSGERQNYLVKVDGAGLFRWAKNNELVDTDDKRFRDSVHGVVPVEDEAPRFGGNSEKAPSEPESTSSRSSPLPERTVNESNGDQTTSTQEDSEVKKDDKKSSRVNPVAIYDRFAGSLSVKKGMWIFVADTSFRIYVGIKDPGAFQHSSFLMGKRIAAAGMLKIRKGQLRSLSPLSGHYRPHIANFRAFHHCLQERGVDLSRVSISKSYAVLAGIEGYGLTKRKIHAVHEKLDTTKDKIHLRHPHTDDAGG